MEDGEQPKKPDESKQKAGVGEPPAIFFNSDTQRLSFGGDRIIDVATSPSDPILGRGELQVGSVVFIGRQEDGNISLSGTTLQIVDSPTGDVQGNRIKL